MNFCTSSLPLTVEAAIALVWITMVAGLPLITMKYEGRNITMTHLGLFVTMWAAFLGGIFLFTNVIAFKSAHFKAEERTLTIVECVYLMSQILTTVGYGDITPAHPQGQIFIGLYVVLTLLIIAEVVSDVANLVTSVTEKYIREMKGLLPAPVKEMLAHEGEMHHTLSGMLENKAPPLPWRKLARSFLVYALSCLIGIAFYALHPGEGKDWFQATYMSIITLSTVGFGAITPQTEAGMVFGAFWMLFGSFALVAVIKNFTQLTAMMKTRERWEKLRQELLGGIREQLPDQFSLRTFTRYCLLEQGLVTQHDLDTIEATFEALAPDPAREASKEDLVRSWGSA